MNQHPDSNTHVDVIFLLYFHIEAKWKSPAEPAERPGGAAAGGGASSRGEGSERLPSAGGPGLRLT